MKKDFQHEQMEKEAEKYKDQILNVTNALLKNPDFPSANDEANWKMAKEVGKRKKNLSPKAENKRTKGQG